MQSAKIGLMSPWETKKSGKYLMVLILFFMMHIIMVFVAKSTPGVMKAHFAIAMSIGFWLAFSSSKMEEVAYAAAYIVGSEVLWRMTGSGAYYEVAKYSIASIFLLALVRKQKFRNFLLYFLYFIFFLPSIFLLIGKMDSVETRKEISFNLSGPLLLFMSCWFFSNLKMTKKNLINFFLILTGPILGICFAAFYGMIKTENLRFHAYSNIITSGGFGPNQVSAILGLGALSSFLLLTFQGIKNFFFKLLMLAICIGMLAQGTLTFSRGGVYLAFGSAALYFLYLIKERKKRNYLFIAIIVLIILGNLIMPKLDSFTQNALGERFRNTDSSGRDQLFQDDINIFMENPIMGVGPGQAASLRTDSGTAHTEYSRILAEHGSLGVMALLLLFLIGFTAFQSKRTREEKALTLSLLSWGFGFMLINAMRLSAVSVIIGLCCSHFIFEETD